VPDQDLEKALRELPRIGKLIKDRPYRQVWRFEFSGHSYYLKFYPTSGWRNWLRKRARGSAALREFHRLQWLQKAGVPSPRAVAALMGFEISGQKGDAVILDGIEPSLQLDQHLNQLALDGKEIPNHLQLVRQLADLLSKLGRAGLGHSDLHLGNFILKDDKVYLLDAYAVHGGGLRTKDIQLLALSAQPYVTRTDLQRVWKSFGSAGPLPASNGRGPSIWRGLLNRAFQHDRYFGHLRDGDWSGHFFRHAKFPHRWSAASRMDIAEKDWQEAWPILLRQIEADQLEVLKRSRSGDVLTGQIVLGGRAIPVVIKRPRKKFWYRYFNEILRGSRPRRAWRKAWQLVVRNIPTAWPMLMMEKRSMGYVTDALIISERIEGQTLASPCWRERGVDEYHELLRRTGRLLRQLEQTGLYLYDAKAENWMVREDEVLGPTPMLIDVDSVRLLNQGGGLPRLLRSLRENQQLEFSRADALALVRGYAPFATANELERLCGVETARANISKLPAANREAGR
jgi:tRNA A-37 threonylcarbamoyl transferase component Bud32